MYYDIHTHILMVKSENVCTIIVANKDWLVKQLHITKHNTEQHCTKMHTLTYSKTHCGSPKHRPRILNTQSPTKQTQRLICHTGQHLEMAMPRRR